MQALLALLLPTHFLYAFLYYTDMGAATSLLASYLVGPSALQSPQVHPHVLSSSLGAEPYMCPAHLTHVSRFRIEAFSGMFLHCMPYH